MLEKFHELIDSATIAFDEQGIGELEMRNAVISTLSKLALEKLGPSSELPYILDPACTDDEIDADLEEYNGWKTPNEKFEEKAL